MLLVLGNAAHTDLIAHVDSVPAGHQVAGLTAGPATLGRWVPGGSAMTVAAVAAETTKVRLWHPIPRGGAAVMGLPALREAGIDLSHCPVIDNTVHCVLIEPAGGDRLCWSESPATAQVDASSLLSGVTAVVVTPVWGSWTEAVLAEAATRGLVTALIGDPSAAAALNHWTYAILDRRQFEAHPIKAEILVLTDGAAGCEVIEDGVSTKVSATEVTVVDTSGAGDTFGADFVARVLGGESAIQAAKGAADRAAQACTEWGSRQPPRWLGPIGTPLSRSRGALLGVACGDAFGMPNSFLQQPVWRTGMDPGPDNSPYHAGYPAGRITDDTEQALALTDSLRRSGKHLDAAIAAQDLMAWFDRVGGEHSLAVGPSTKRALIALRAGVPLEDVGTSGVTNGAPMRIAPIGVWGALAGLSEEELVSEVASACLPTHNTSVAISGAAAIALAVWAGVHGQSWPEAIETACRGADLGEKYGRWTYAPSVSQRIRWACAVVRDATGDADVVRLISELVGTGEPVTESVPAAFAAAAYAAGDPHLAITIAGNLRGDTDTVGAMTGAICGAQTGSGAFPPEWEALIRQVNDVDFDVWTDALATHPA